jgi:UDP-N-acetylglucosamine--N-acetylmuramyl-(pentapeptide) pyrophosphoryl-undecaprenol N-acetylglucosamine transferase
MRKVIEAFKPDVAFSTGGYVTGPVMYAAAKKKIPTVILEQDAALGLANKFLSKTVDTICYVFDSGVEQIKHLNIVKTGNPASENVLNPSSNETSIEGLDISKKIMLITGGSLGAKVFEELVISKSKTDFDYQIVYATGKKNYQEFMKYEINHPNIIVLPYIEDMPSLLQHVDLIVGRAGATSITENLALGIPSIIIPYPSAGNNEQLKNALQIEADGACKCIEEKDIDSDKLFEQAEEILFNQEMYQKMKDAALKLGIRDSATRVYNELKKVMKV